MLTDELLVLLLAVVGILGLFVGAPVAILVWLEPRWRAVALFLGLALAAIIYWPATGGDPRGGWIFLIGLSLGTSIAALLVEIPACLIRIVGRRQQDPAGRDC